MAFPLTGPFTDSSGNIKADYAYDAFGNQTLLDGTPIGDVGYAGYFYHANSGLTDKSVG